MHFEFRVYKFPSRVVVVAAGFGLCFWLVYIILCQFVKGALVDERSAVAVGAEPFSFIANAFTGDPIPPSALAMGLRYLPDSARLYMKLAEFEKLQPGQADDRVAEFYATRAVQISPNDYNTHLLLASIENDNDDTADAEGALREAIRLAPYSADAHYVLGTILLGRGSWPESFEELKRATSIYGAYFQPALDLVWQATKGDANAARAITPNTVKDRIGLASFLLEKSHVADSAAVFRELDARQALADRRTADYLNAMIHDGQIAIAYALWRGLMRDGEQPADPSDLVWNGGFESDILVDFAQFGWSIEPSEYAALSIDGNVAHSGKRSLRIDFLGRETTKLNNEVKQIVPVHRGTQYRVQYHVRTQDLTAPSAPLLVITPNGSQEWIAASEPVPSGSNDWQKREFEFTAPADSIVLAVKLRPKFSYESPTRGVLWFDDVALYRIE